MSEQTVFNIRQALRSIEWRLAGIGPGAEALCTFYSWLLSLASDQLLVACQLLAEGSSLSSVLPQCPRYVGLVGPGEGDRRSMA